MSELYFVSVVLSVKQVQIIQGVFVLLLKGVSICFPVWNAVIEVICLCETFIVASVANAS